MKRVIMIALLFLYSLNAVTFYKEEKPEEKPSISGNEFGFTKPAVDTMVLNAYYPKEHGQCRDVKHIEVNIQDDVSENESYVEVNEEEVEMLACVIYCEAGGDACSDLCRMYVGDVVLNRVNDSRFPDTIKEVLTQKSQYGRFHWTGIVWPERAKYDGESEAVERSYRIARELLSGEHSEIFGEGYIWQAEFSQGKDTIYLDGLYFGR